MLDFKSTIQELYQVYQNSLSLDSKPEKGERKIADDFIVLINEQSEKTTT